MGNVNVLSNRQSVTIGYCTNNRPVLHIVKTPPINSSCLLVYLTTITAKTHFVSVRYDWATRERTSRFEWIPRRGKRIQAGSNITIRWFGCHYHFQGLGITVAGSIMDPAAIAPTGSRWDIPYCIVWNKCLCRRSVCILNCVDTCPNR